MLVKICGITTLEAAQAAAECGADLIGFVFAPSRRRIDPAAAADIVAKFPAVRRAGVFVNQPLAEVQAITAQCRLDFIQLHGDETADYCRAMPKPVIRAIRVGADFQLAALANGPDCDYVLLDTLVTGQYGGTGVSFDWQKLAQQLVRPGKPFLLAGGLTVENVAQAIHVLNPDGVDVSGGVETAGCKDPDKIRRFIAAARQAAERSQAC